MRYPQQINVSIEKLEETTSTNDYLSELCRQGKAEEFYTVIAEKQTAGKGQRGNSWISESGKSLTFSLVLYPTVLEANKQFFLSMLAAVSIVDALTDYTEGFSIKWPNDIYWKDKKICGILIENELEGNFLGQSIIGIGLNVNQTSYPSSLPNPISLHQIVGKEINREEILRKIIHAIIGGYRSLETKFDETSQSLAYLYKNLLYRKEGFHRYKDCHGEFMAEIQDVGSDGYLYLRNEANLVRKYAFKEVIYIHE